MISPASRAGQIDRKYVRAKSSFAVSEKPGAAVPLPVMMEVPNEWVSAVVGILMEYGHHFAQINKPATRAVNTANPMSSRRCTAEVSVSAAVIDPPREARRRRTGIEPA